MAIQLPNNKISRTLPEQVGFNSAKIEEIIKWINDSDFIDKVLNLSDPSGTLTEAQYAIADLSPSYIVYGGKVFVKSLEDSDNIDFFKVGTDMSGSDSIVASVERVRIVKATKAYQYEVVQLFESYNKTQLDTFLASKANLSGADFTGDITAKTLTQNEANWSANNIFDEITVAEGLEYTNIYSRFEELNGILYIVHIFTIKNNTDASINAVIAKTITLPEDIAKKVYDVTGRNVHEQSPYNIISTYVMYGTSSELTSSRVFSLRNRNTADVMEYTSASATPIAANTTVTFTFREFLTLK